MATRRASALWTVLIASVMTFVASQAWAVVVDMTVKDTAGAVPDMEITFTPEDRNLPTTTGRTDTQGRVVGRDGKAVVLPPKPHKVRVRGRHNVTATETWPGDTASFSMTVERIMPWMVQNPPCSLCFGLGAGYYGQWADDVKLQPGETEIVRFPGRDPITLFDTSADNKFGWSVNGGTVHIPMGIRPFQVGTLRVNPAFSFEAGGGDLTIDATRKSDGVKQFQLHGSGTVVGAGLGAIATRPNSSWYLRAGYDYWTLFDAELERDPCSTPGTFTSCRSRAEANSHSHSIWGGIGFNLPTYPISLDGGIKATWQTADVKTNIIRVLPGLMGEVINDVSQKFERDTVEGIAGMNAHFGGPLFGRFETTFNGSDVSLMFKLIYGIGFVDPYLSPGPRHAP